MVMKGSFRRRRFSRRKFTRRSKGYVTQRQFRAAMRRNRPEVKFTSGELAAQSDAAGTVDLLSNLGQGVADGERVGLKAKALSLQFNAIVLPDDVSDQFLRFIVFQWFDDYNSPPLTGQILEDDTGTGTPSIVSVYNWRYKPKYRIIFDKLYAVGATNAANAVKTIRKYIKIPSMMQWVDDDGSHYAKGGLFLLTVGTGAAGEQPTYNFTYKLSYTDV